MVSITQPTIAKQYTKKRGILILQSHMHCIKMSVGRARNANQSQWNKSREKKREEKYEKYTMIIVPCWPTKTKYPNIQSE